MVLGIHARPWLWYAAAAAAAVMSGALVAVAPKLAVGAVAVIAVTALAFVAPVFHLTLLLAITLIVPFEFLNAYSFGGANSPGLLITDALLLTGLLRAVLVLVEARLDRRQLAAALVIVALVLAWTLQSWRGIQASAVLSDVGFELRALLGWSALIIAMPMLADPRARNRLFAGFLATGLALGIWGLVQYFVNVPFDDVGHYGVRESVNFTSGARQIQGGLFGFPVAFLLAVAALASGESLSTRVRALIIAVAVTNGLSLLFTFQRTFWLATAAAFCLLIARGHATQRAKSLAALIALCAVAIPILAATSPSVLGDARTRLLSVSQYASDNSLRARLVESRQAMIKTQQKPWIGWGLGDEVRWGMPWLRVPPRNHTFLHNGYLWMSWKLGVPAAALLIALIAWAIVARGPADVRPLVARMRHGAQATLLAMLAIGLTFPTFRVLVITPTLGVLLAFCLMPRHSTKPADAAS